MALYARPLPPKDAPSKDASLTPRPFQIKSASGSLAASSNPALDAPKQRGIYSEYLGGATTDSVRHATSGPASVQHSAQPHVSIPARAFNLNKRHGPASAAKGMAPKGVMLDTSSASSAAEVNPFEDDVSKAPLSNGLPPGPSPLDPKVAVPFKTQPGKPPRRIEVERKKRLFASQDIAKLLLDKGVDYSRFWDGADHQTGQPSHLPLDVFDDSELQYRAPEEWLLLAARVPARALCFPPNTSAASSPASGRWLTCDVVAYDAAARRYTVLFSDAPSVPLLLPPIHVLFVTEDPFLFAARVARAHKLRREFEACIRYALYVDSMPIDEMQVLDSEQVNRIVHLAQSTPKLMKYRQDVTALLQEVNINYARTMNKIIFDTTLSDPAQRSLYSSLAPALPSIFSSDAAATVASPLAVSVASAQSGRSAPASGVVPVPFHDFPNHFSDFCFHSVLTKAEALAALVKVNTECLKLQRMSIFNIAIPKSIRVEEFEQVQQSSMLQLSNTLKDKWVAALKNCITSSLKQVGKGWFNLNEQNLEVYSLSKLKKFMTVANFIMQDSVRFLAEDSFAKYAAFVRRICAYKVEIKGTAQVKVTLDAAMALPGPKDPLLELMQTDQEAFIHGLARMPNDFSLFTAELTAKDGVISLSTRPEQLIAVPLAVMEKGLHSLVDIPQLETRVMEHLYPYGNDVTLATVRRDEPWVVELLASAAKWLEAALVPLKTYVAQFTKYQELLQLDIDAYVAEWGEEENDFDDIAREIETHMKAAETIERDIPRSVNLGLVTLSLEDVRRQLITRHRIIVQKELDMFATQTKARCLDVGVKFRVIESKIKQNPEDIHSLVKLREYIATVPMTIGGYKRTIQDVMSAFELLDKFNYRLSVELFKLKWTTYAWPKTIADQIALKELQLNNDRQTFLTDMQQKQEDFVGELLELEKKVNGFSINNDITKVKQIAAKVEKLNERLINLQRRAQEFNTSEMLFELPSTDYRHVSKVVRLFEPYYLLWTSVSEWMTNREKWMSEPFMTLKGEEINTLVTGYYKAMSKAIKAKVIQSNPGCYAIADTIKRQVEEFRPHLPLILALRNPGMRPRHWDMLRAQLPVELPHPDENPTLTKLLTEYQLQGHIDIITAVGDTAGKEYQIEAALDKMEDAWREVEFTVVPYKKTGTFIIKDVDPIIQLLDEHLMTTQSMQFSPFKKYFDERISRWSAKLTTVYEVIEEWLAVQRQWLGLQAIFASPDIMKQLFAEGKRFQQVHKMWRSMMTGVHGNPDVLSFCDNPGLLQKLQDSNQQLQMVQKRLSDYLDKKRLAFPRFYFLSDEELLQILSQTQDPTAVQPHLKKCFENINNVQFEKDSTITAMFSAEQERVPFTKAVDPRGQNVEDWLGQVEKQMRESVRYWMEQAVRDYVVRPRSQWVQNWPGQCVLNGSQLHWTAEVEAALKTQGFNGIQRYQAKLGEQLHSLVDLVRGNLSNLLSLTLGALIVLDVHARDVVDSLVKAKVSSAADFQWICQMRYYQEDKQLWVQMVQSRFPYGYEYLGNTLRLVITPLTDRCYMTLMTALSLSLGGAPAGPAGTGKTESVKDLAKAVAKQCVVFNCSEGLNYLAMGKFFKGLASSGAWSCFDEFNRIDIEVLSVVAQQIMTIYEAVKLGVAHFTFEDAEISLEPTCAVFVTMNPGYAGRTELPDNLKALFRPVAMMVPDYALIAQIMLYSFGFNDAKSLARKMVTTFKLASEQLSTQDHYDYGMRAVKTVITRAGILKREDPKMNEDALLLQALLDVNMPKFLKQDLPLFEGIISDLFPGVAKPEAHFGPLQNAIMLSCKEQGLQPVPSFTQKCLQIYETTVVRHGLMVVGPSGGGKSCARNVLAAALNRLHGVDSFMRVEERVINPKALTMAQLYGDLDTNSKEWTDGIIALVVRECIAESEADTNHWQWVVFDGPVDALWIENMNTVLDDNKKLCLVSQEILKLTNQMRMVFEVEDLAVASPATVSRCGMVYLEPSAMGVQPLIMSWIERLHPVFNSVRAQIIGALEMLVEPALTFVRRRHVDEPVPSVDSNLVLSMLGLLDAFMAPHIPLNEDGSINWDVGASDDVPGPSMMKGNALRRASLTLSVAATANVGAGHQAASSSAEGGETAVSAEESRNAFKDKIVSYIILCAVWSFGATTDRPGRAKFSNFFRLLLQSCNLTAFGPPEMNVRVLNDDVPASGGAAAALVYDYTFDPRVNQWVPWMDTQPAFEIDPRLTSHEIIVPTADSVRSIYILDLLVKAGRHVLFTGQTGTGKTVNVIQYLGRLPDKFQPLTLTFSAATTANQTEDIIFPKLTKRRQKIYGPPIGKRSVIFVDDLNMPARERYFAQPAIELLRQFMDYGGWYNRHTLQFIDIVDTGFIAAMGPPGGGRNPVTARFTRHFHQVAHTELDRDSLALIFSTIVQDSLKAFVPEVASLAHNIVDASIEVYQRVCQELLPTPSRSHYTFNLRDLAAQIHGLLSTNPKRMKHVTSMLRLWVHESRRAFEDRLVSADDVQYLETLLAETLKKHFNCEWDDVVPERLLFGDYCDGLQVEHRFYDEIKDYDAALKVMERALLEHNEDSTHQMKLVLFGDAIEHVSRLSRVLRTPGGHALLLGVGGSGRQSLTRLAAYMGEFALVQIEMNKGFGMAEWRDAIKTMLLSSGLKEQPTVFLFSDTQISHESFLEDVNNLLNSGEVPNLFSNDDMDTIFATCKVDCQRKSIPQNKINAYGQFLLRIKANLHVVLCMSPLGEAFRTRLRMYPSLVNCCYIDWFAEWPNEALRSVGYSVLQEEDLNLGLPESTLVAMFTYIHEVVEQQSKVYLAKLRRYNYVTPTSYLELLSIFKVLLRERRADIGGLRTKLQSGLNTLADAAKTIAQLEIDLREKQPKLEARQLEVAQMQADIEHDTRDAAVTKEVVEKQEADAASKAAECKDIRDEAQAELDKALPMLDKAVECLKELQKAHIDEVRNFKKPPPGVILTMEACCIMLAKPWNLKIVMRADPLVAGKSKPDYWETAQKQILRDPKKLLDTLQNYDRDNIPESVIQKIAPYITSPEFQVKKIENASKACRAICMWVHAMYQYHQVALVVEPKRVRLRVAESELERVMADLHQAKQRLDTVNARLAMLQERLDEAIAESERLQREVDLCKVKLLRAKTLTGGLSGEGERWTNTIAEKNHEFGHILGDVFVSAGTIAYLGAFTADFRADMVAVWRRKLVELQIPHTENCTVRSTLGDPMQIRAWTITGLPTDQVSIDNAIIMYKARRWPLMIDPQGQASKFIKRLGEQKWPKGGMHVVQTSDKNWLHVMETAIQMGFWVLIENLKEDIEQVLEPVLLQQVSIINGQPHIRLGDSQIPFSDSFHLYLTTKLPNPHYPPELQVKVTLLNFTITRQGLEDQMLGAVVNKEAPELEATKSEIVVQNARMKRTLQETEDHILKLLAESGDGDILEKEDLITVLTQSKQTSEEMNSQLATAEVIERDIDEKRKAYEPVAMRAAVLYFCIADLAQVDPMYQYSLQWFVSLFLAGVSNAPPSAEVETRLKNINEYFTLSLFQNVCRSLFESHKLLFGFLLAVAIMQADNKIDPVEWRFLVAGSSGASSSSAEGGAAASPTNTTLRNPAPEWLTDNTWTNLMTLSSLPALSGFDRAVVDNVSVFKHYFDSQSPHLQPLPEPWQSAVTDIQRMIILKSLRPDKVSSAIQAFVGKHLGPEFTETPQFNLHSSFKDSTNTTPLIFILSKGADPASALFALATELNVREKTYAVSLGQGQEGKAAKSIALAAKQGGWVLLQNCHLAVSWLPQLEQIIAGLNAEETHEDFRLWLTSMPTPRFPVSILQSGVKMTNEPPKGLKANLLRSYTGFSDQFLNKSKKPRDFKKLLFSLCFFHAVILDRRKFGPLGWNIAYEFTENDLGVCVTQLRDFIDMYEQVPYQVIHFLTYDINYGGRVTDDVDRRTIRTILDDFINPNVLQDDYAFSSSGKYVSLPAGNRANYLQLISALDNVPEPEVFGMHENADITSAQEDTIQTFNTIVALLPRDISGSGKSREELIGEIGANIFAKIPQPWEIETITKRFPTMYSESMNTVLTQECILYNRLITKIRSSLESLARALKGEMVMTIELDRMADALFNNAVPESWAFVAYPSLMPLASWVQDLLARISFLNKWIQVGTPKVFWMGGFFFPQAFLTGTLQNFARKYKKPIDSISFSFRVLDQAAAAIADLEHPADGVYVHGLFLEGARWDADAKALADSRPKELVAALPVLWLLPEEERKAPETGVYRAPVYKTLTRQGTLSTTGHSTNFVMFVELPSAVPEAKWIKAGVALFCSLRYYSAPQF